MSKKIHIDFSNDRHYNFDSITFNGEKRLIVVKYPEKENKLISIIEIYSAIKQSYVKYADELLKYPYPIEYITESSIRIINGWNIRIKSV